MLLEKLLFEGLKGICVPGQASLDRGFGRCTVLRKHGALLKKHPNRACDTVAPPSAGPSGQARELSLLSLPALSNL
jgi:hypothetical protein